MIIIQSLVHVGDLDVRDLKMRIQRNDLSDDQSPESGPSRRSRHQRTINYNDHNDEDMSSEDTVNMLRFLLSF